MGRVYGDVGVMFTPKSGVQIAKFKVEVATHHWGEDSEIRGETTLIPCTMFNSPSVAAAMIDGMRVLVIGVLNAKVYKDDKTMVNVIVRKVEFLDKARRGERSPDKLVMPKIIGQEKWRK